MNLGELIADADARLARGSPSLPVTAVAEDSRQAAPGCLFVARQGTRADGRQFIADAVQRGAEAVLTDDARAAPPGIALVLADDVPKAAAQVAERFFGSPSRELRLIGVTGTNGKTTTAHLMHQLLNQSGIRCGLIGTVQVDDGRSTRAAALTTPPAIDISGLLRDMVDHGCAACVMEVSSHALDQRRVAGLWFAGGIFTNLTGDHLDYHGTMPAYAAAKARLFEALPADGFAIINIDDPRAKTMAQACAARVLTSSATGRDADCRAAVGRRGVTEIELTLTGPWGSSHGTLPLVGTHNVSNALQAAAACHQLGLTADQLRAGLERCVAPPGRLQPVTHPDDDLVVLVDYAHTDDALRNVLTALKPLAPPGAALRVVFGCGGDRDRGKRPRMAAVAAQLADDIIITSDNPRTEDPLAIIAEIVDGLPPAQRRAAAVEPDRQRAIHIALARAKPGDIVLIAGKGHEDYQIIGTSPRPFDDRLIARQALDELRPKVSAA